MNICTIFFLKSFHFFFLYYCLHFIYWNRWAHWLCVGSKDQKWLILFFKFQKTQRSKRFPLHTKLAFSVKQIGNRKVFGYCFFFSSTHAKSLIAREFLTTLRCSPFITWILHFVLAPIAYFVLNTIIHETYDFLLVCQQSIEHLTTIQIRERLC